MIINRFEILNQIKEAVQNNKQWIYMYCHHFQYATENLTKEINELGCKIFSVPEKMIFLSNPPQYKVYLKKYHD